MLGPAPGPLCYPLPALGPHCHASLSLEMSHRETPCHRQLDWLPPPSPRRPSATNYWAAKRLVLAEKTVRLLARRLR